MQYASQNYNIVVKFVKKPKLSNNPPKPTKSKNRNITLATITKDNEAHTCTAIDVAVVAGRKDIVKYLMDNINIK